MAVVGSSGMAYLASISTLISQYGAIAWVGVALCSFLVIGLSLACFSFWKERSAMTDFARKSTFAAKSNPLSKIHSDEMILMADFFHPYYKPIADVRFENCDLMGPANIFVDGGGFHNCGFWDCEVVIIRTDRRIAGCINLVRPMVINCNFYRIIFFMTIDGFNNLRPDLKAIMPIISDGRVGDI